MAKHIRGRRITFWSIVRRVLFSISSGVAATLWLWRGPPSLGWSFTLIVAGALTVLVLSHRRHVFLFAFLAMPVESALLWVGLLLSTLAASAIDPRPSVNIGADALLFEFTGCWPLSAIFGLALFAITRWIWRPSDPHGPYCPQCDYCLVGLQDRKCPECGRPFSPEELRIRASDLLPP